MATQWLDPATVHSLHQANAKNSTVSVLPISTGVLVIADQQTETIRVTIQQPSLAKYRVPVFTELANRNGISLFVAFGNRAGLTNAEPDGFEGKMFPLTRKKIGPVPIYWHHPQISFAKKSKSDVIVLTWNSQYLSLVPALLRAKWNGVGTIVWGHGYSKREGRIRLWLRKWIARLADAVLFYDFHTAERYVNDYGFKREKIFTAANSIDQKPIREATAYWKERPEELKRFQQQHEVEEGPLVLFVSRLHRDNRLELLLQAIEKLAADFPGIKAAIVGKGEEETARLSELAHSLGIQNRLIFTGPIYEEQELAKWFLSSTVFCYPANIGLSLFHAFGYGVPVVTSDNIAGQNPEIFALQDGHNGLFYKDGDDESLSLKLREMFGNNNERDELSANAIATAQTKFNIPCMVDGLEAAIQFADRQYNRSN